MRPAIINSRVCERCNNRWMSDLETQTSEFLKPMILAAGPCELTPKQQSLLRFWIAKTACTVDGGRDDPCYPDSFATDLYEKRRPPDNMVILLGSYSGTTRLATGACCSFSVFGVQAGIPAGDDLFVSLLQFGAVLAQCWLPRLDKTRWLLGANDFRTRFAILEPKPRVATNWPSNPKFPRGLSDEEIQALIRSRPYYR